MTVKPMRTALPSQLRLSAAKVSNKEDSEVFCWADPRIGAWRLQHQIFEEETHTLDTFFHQKLKTMQ